MNFQESRKAMGLSVNELAKILKCSAAAIYSWESGDREVPLWAVRAVEILTGQRKPWHRIRGKVPHRLTDGQIVRVLRVRACLTTEGLAAILGVTSATICHWEDNGKVPARHMRNLRIELGYEDPPVFELTDSAERLK